MGAGDKTFASVDSAGAEIMREGERVAREMGWEGLYLTVRAGHGIERFYTTLGYKEVGRLPGTLRRVGGGPRGDLRPATTGTRS